MYGVAFVENYSFELYNSYVSTVYERKYVPVTHGPAKES